MSAYDPKRTLDLGLPEPFTRFCAGISFAAHEVRQLAVAEFSEFVAFADTAPPFRNALERNAFNVVISLRSRKVRAGMVKLVEVRLCAVMGPP